MGNKKWEWRFHYYEHETMFLRCSSCKKNKPCTDFFNSKSKPLGYAWECKECSRDRKKKYYSIPENKEHKHETDKLYRKNNQNKIKLKKQEWQRKNREKYIQSCKLAYQKRKEQSYDSRKAWREKTSSEFWVSINAIHNRTERYINKYNLRPSSCSICWQEWLRIEAHHPSYSTIENWKEVVFVCKWCHRDIHCGNIQCPEPIDLVQLNAHMPTILTDKDLDLFSKIENGQTWKENN